MGLPQTKILSFPDVLIAFCTLLFLPLNIVAKRERSD